MTIYEFAQLIVWLLSLSFLIISAVAFLLYDQKHKLYYQTLGLYLIAIATVTSNHYSLTDAKAIPNHVLMYFFITGFVLYFLEIIKLFSALPSSWDREKLAKIQKMYIWVTSILYLSVIVLEIVSEATRLNDQNLMNLRFYLYMTYGFISAVAILTCVLTILKTVFLYVNVKDFTALDKFQIKVTFQKAKVLVSLLAINIVLMLSLYVAYSILQILVGSSKLLYDIMLFCSAVCCRLCHTIFGSFSGVLKIGIYAHKKMQINRSGDLVKVIKDDPIELPSKVSATIEATRL